MILRTLLLPLAMAAGFAFAAPGAAHASPLGGSLAGKALGGVRVGVGVGVNIPIGGYYREGRYFHSSYPGGYWIQTGSQTVMVPDHVIGYDVYGQPIWSYNQVIQPTYQWVPAAPVVRRVHYYRARPTISLGLGFGWRIR
jgi:hypothetical protein